MPLMRRSEEVRRGSATLSIKCPGTGDGMRRRGSGDGGGNRRGLGGGAVEAARDPRELGREAGGAARRRASGKAASLCLRMRCARGGGFIGRGLC